MHNLQVMNKKNLSKALGEGFEIKFLDYYKTCLLSFHEENAELNKYPVLKKIFLSLKKMMCALKLDDIPSRFFSPYLIMIAQRNCSQSINSNK